MKILFHISPAPEHLEATFPLARALAQRGDDVAYTAIDDVQPIIDGRGLRCVAIHPRAVPRGTLGAIEQLSTEEQRAWAQVALDDRIADDYFRGAIEAQLQDLAPAIVIADVATFSPIQFAAHRLGIPCLQLSMTLPQRLDGLPPLTSALLPDAPGLMLAGARWQASCLHRTVGALRVPMIVSARSERYAARFGYPADQISFDAALDPALTALPEVIACASALDFPRPRDAPPFVAMPIDLEHPEHVSPELAAFVDGSRPLIYASIGDAPERAPRAARWFDAVAGALEARPDWHAVIATGRWSTGDAAVATRSNNVLRLDRAPQRWLLRRAAVFATHASLLGIREAIALAVPMIAVPQRRDQPGNAARVAHHGIGVQLPPDLVSRATFAAAVERVLGETGAYRARLRALDEACRAEESAHRAIDAIDRVAGRRLARRPPITRPAPRRDDQLGWAFIDREPPRSHGERAVCAELGDALAGATGPRLARVQIAAASPPTEGATGGGPALRCLWIVDASDALHDYARWCAIMALEAEHEAAPEHVALIQDLMAQHRAARRAGEPVEAAVRDIHEQAAPRWHHGYGAAAFAVGPVAHEAAQRARLEALLTLTRQHAGAAAGTAEAAERCAQRYHALVARFDAELERRLGELVRAASPDEARRDGAR